MRGRRDGSPGVRAWRVAAAFIIVAAVALTFRDSLQNQFVEWDDQIAIVTNPHIRGLSLENIRWMFTTFHLGPYQPFAWLSLAVDYEVWGLNPRGFHLTSLVIHAGNALLVFATALMLLAFGQPADRPKTAERIAAVAALFGTLFYAIHPQRVESVAWATERRDLLCGLFTLLSVISWVARAQRLRIHADEPVAHGDRTQRGALYALSWVSFVFALLSKASVIGLPIVLVAFDTLYLRLASSAPRTWLSARNRRVLTDKIPFVIAAAIFGVVALYGQHDSQAIRSAEDVSYARRLGTAIHATAFYLEKMAAPVSLSPLYERPPDTPRSRGRAAVEGAAVILLVLGALRAAKRRPAILAALVSYLALLGPVSGVVPIGSHFAADRYTYVANIPWAILGAGAFAALLTSPSAPGSSRRYAAMGVGLAAAALLTVLSVQTAKQTRVWSGSFSLWDHAIRMNSNSAIARYGRGVALWRSGHEDAAIADYVEAIRLNPQYSDAHNNLGTIFAARGDLARANEHFLAAASAYAGNPVAQLNLGIIAGKRGLLNEAERHYRNALSLRPEMLSARLNLAQVLAAKGDRDSARELLRQGLAMAPTDSALASALEAFDSAP